MRTLALLFLTAGLLLTAALVPMTQMAVHGRDGNPAGFGILLLCVLRAVALISAFHFLIAAGRLQSWVDSRVMQSVLVTGGLLVLEICCGPMHFLSIDYMVKYPFPMVFGVFATLLPSLVILGGFLASRRLFVVTVAMAIAVGVLSFASYDLLTAQWRAERMKQNP